VNAPLSGAPAISRVTTVARHGAGDATRGNIMRKSRFRSYLDDGLFVVLIMVAAVASAAMETIAMFGAVPSMLPSAMARAKPAYTPQDAASAVQLAARGAVVARH
jgi:hypothetical protein